MIGVVEWCVYYNGFNVVWFVMVIDLVNWLNVWIGVRFICFDIVVFFVLVGNMINEWWNKECVCIGICFGLIEWK